MDGVCGCTDVGAQHSSLLWLRTGGILVAFGCRNQKDGDFSIFFIGKNDCYIIIYYIFEYILIRFVSSILVLYINIHIHIHISQR